MEKVFSEWFSGIIINLSKKFDLPLSAVIEKLAVHRIATVTAELDYYKTLRPEQVAEFVDVSGEPLMGKELFSLIYNMRLNELKTEHSRPKELTQQEKELREEIKRLQESGEIGQVETEWENDN